MAKNKRKPPAAAVKRTQSLHAPVPSHTNQDGSPVPSCISAPGHGTTSPQEVDGSPVANSKPDGSLVDNPTASGSPVDNTNGSPVDNTNGSLEKVLEEGCYEDEDLGEEHLDFSCSEEDYPPSSPVTVVPDLVAGSVEKSHCVAPLNPRATQSTPVVPAPPACPKGATFTPSGSAPVDTTAAPSPAEVRSVKKVDAASVTSEGNVNDKGSVFTRLTPVADSLGDDPPAVAPPVESTPIVTPPVDGPELDAPSNPSVSPVAPDGQPRPQATPASVEEWQPVRNRRNNAGNKRRTQTPSPVNGPLLFNFKCDH
ncbi:hypothetical protein OIU77_007060 [Salix suchowensis]|uniref:Uncharacterized protein n=1 Tax=Salix suchowensis TaxID=1278906 RepID=A0ABQ9AMR8_9ROSI|nr:hypothetical protein OIU77_007060 [Salix suchowensis]